MDKVLGPLKYTIAFPYLDDIIIPLKTIEAGMERLEQILRILREHKLTLKLEKCPFFQTKIEYLGRGISEAVVELGLWKIESVLHMESPQCTKQVWQFLGLASYFRRFVKDYVIITKPLTKFKYYGKA